MSGRFGTSVYVLGSRILQPEGPWQRYDWRLCVVGPRVSGSEAIPISEAVAGIFCFEGLKQVTHTGYWFEFNRHPQPDPDTLRKVLLAVRQNPSYVEAQKCLGWLCDSRRMEPLPPVELSQDVQLACDRIREHQRTIEQMTASIQDEVKKLVADHFGDGGTPYPSAAYKGAELDFCPQSPIGVSLHSKQGCVFCGEVH